MHSQVSELSPVLVEVKIEVPWERVQKDLDETFNRIARTARVKGFRPGKVPRNVVRRLFGKQVRGEVTAQLVEQGLIEAVQEHELQIVAQPEVDPPTLEEGQPLAFTAKCEIRPRVETVDLSRLEVERPAQEVTDEQVNEELERLRREHAELHVPEPMRPAEESDVLTIDYEVTVDGEVREDLGATDRQVELGGGRLLPEFDEGLRGAQPGESRTVEVQFPDDHGREDLRGKTATFAVVVKELQQRVLPEADDEFAKDVGDYETLLELRLKIRQDLESMAERRAESEMREKVVDKLVETNDVPVPPSMIQQQERQMILEFAQFLQMTGQDVPLSEDLHSDMHRRAERRVRAAILLGALARQEGIEIANEEVEDKLRQLAEESGKHIAKVRVEYQGERREALESQLLEEKLMKVLMDRVHYVEPAEEGQADEKSTEQGSAEGAPSKDAPAKAKRSKEGSSDGPKPSAPGKTSKNKPRTRSKTGKKAEESAAQDASPQGEAGTQPEETEKR